MRPPRYLLLALSCALAAPATAERDLSGVTPESLGAVIAALPEQRAVQGGDAYFEGLRKAEDWLIGQLEGFGYEVRTQEVRYTPHRRARGGEGRETVVTRNIWADLRGSEHPEEVVIFCAHFDAVPGSPGANDNGSGVAAVLEGARVLADAPAPRTIRFMFFTAEEFGLIGSRQYVVSVLTPKLESGEERFIGCVNLDVMGYYSDEPGSQRHPRGFPGDPEQAGDFVAVLSFAAQAEFGRKVAEGMLKAEPEVKILLTDFLPLPLPDMMRSDHAPFWNAGLPAVHLTDTANFRYDHYHRSTDTLDKLNLPAYAKVSRAAIGAVVHLATPRQEDQKEDQQGDRPEPQQDTEDEAGENGQSGRSGAKDNAGANNGGAANEKAAAP